MCGVANEWDGLAVELGMRVRMVSPLPGFAPYGYLLDAAWYDPEQGGTAYQGLALGLLMRQGKVTVEHAEVVNLAATLREKAA